ncbi:hypothetical protein BJX70DRAFT_395331 [Aspergillus crustosus]
MSQIPPLSDGYPMRYRCKNPVTQCNTCRIIYNSLSLYMSDDDLLIRPGTYPVKFLRNVPIPLNPVRYEESMKRIIEARLLHLFQEGVKAYVYTFPSPAQARIVGATTFQARVLIDFPRTVALSNQLLQAMFAGLDLLNDWDWHVVAPHPRACWSASRLDWLSSYPVRFIRNMPIGPTPQDEYELALKWVLERRLFNISGQRVKVHMYTFPNARQAAIMNERMPDLPLTIQARVMIDFPRVVVLSPPFMDRVFGALDGHDWDWHVIAPHPRQCWSQFRMDWFATKANLEGNFL